MVAMTWEDFKELEILSGREPTTAGYHSYLEDFRERQEKSAKEREEKFSG